MALFENPFSMLTQPSRNPKGQVLGSVIGSAFPGVGTVLGGQLGNIIGDILPSSGGPAREGGGSTANG